MPQQNWREEVDKLIFDKGVYDADMEHLDTVSLKAFIETLLARVIDSIPDGDLLNEGVTSDGIKYQDWSNYNVPVKQALKAKYLTQLRSEFGIKEGK